MASLRRVLCLPAQESTVSVVLVLSVLMMSFMSIALVWETQIIMNQRESIQSLQQLLKIAG